MGEIGMADGWDAPPVLMFHLFLVYVSCILVLQFVRLFHDAQVGNTPKELCKEAWLIAGRGAVNLGDVRGACALLLAQGSQSSSVG